MRKRIDVYGIMEKTSMTKKENDIKPDRPRIPFYVSI